MGAEEPGNGQTGHGAGSSHIPVQRQINAQTTQAIQELSRPQQGGVCRNLSQQLDRAGESVQAQMVHGQAVGEVRFQCGRQAAVFGRQPG